MHFSFQHKFFLLAFLLSFSFALCVSSQSVKQLEEQRKQTLQQLEITNKLLNETKQSQKSSLNKLTILDKSIKERTRLVNTMNKEIEQLDIEMKKLAQEKAELEKKLQQLKNDYARLVQEAYINRSIYSKIMFVLSAETFDQSIRRLRYLKEYSDYRKMQVKEIERVEKEIQTEK